VHPAPPNGEPPDAARFDGLRETCKRLAKAAAYRADPDADAEKWTGEPINPI